VEKLTVESGLKAGDSVGRERYVPAQPRRDMQICYWHTYLPRVLRFVSDTSIKRDMPVDRLLTEEGAAPQV